MFEWAAVKGRGKKKKVHCQWRTPEILSFNSPLSSFISQVNSVLWLFLSISAGADQIVTLCAICAGRKQCDGMDQRCSLSSYLELPSFVVYVFLLLHAH